MMGGLNLNPVATIMALKDSIALTPEQMDKLKPLSDAVAAKNALLVAEFQKLTKDAGANPDMGALFGKLRPRLEAQGKERAEMLKAVQAILTAEQWEKVPERVRNPPQGFGGPGGQRRPGQ